MKRVYCLIIIALFMISSAACQATPEKQIVIQKDMEKMIEKGMAESGTAKDTGVALRERVKAPETFVYESVKDNFTVSSNAPIRVPEAGRMPIIRVKAGEFTQEQVTKFWDALVGDTVLWQRGELTKSEIQKKLVILRKTIAQHEDTPAYAEAVKDTKAEIEKLEAQYKDAPEEIQMTAADSTLREVKTALPDSGAVYISETAGGNTKDYSMSFYAQNITRTGAGEIISPANMGFSKKDANYNYGQTNTVAVDEHTVPDENMKEHIKTTPAEAKTLIEGFLKKTGAPMAVYSMNLVNDEETGIYDGKTAPAKHYAYGISCLRMVDNGLPCARIQGSTIVENKTMQDPEFVEYSKQWDYEEMNFMVNDSGIIQMTWRAPLELIETKVADSALMPFSEIQAIFEKMIPITYEATAKGMDNVTCRIEEVRLEMMRIVEQGSIENGLLIPVWNFYGVRERTYKGKTDKTGKYIQLCVNAIDGSIINITKGY